MIESGSQIRELPNEESDQRSEHQQRLADPAMILSGLKWLWVINQ
jgi:hypothetical protein